MLQLRLNNSLPGMSCIWSNNFCNRCPRKLFCSKFWYNCETNDRNVSV